MLLKDFVEAVRAVEDGQMLQMKIGNCLTVWEDMTQDRIEELLSRQCDVPIQDVRVKPEVAGKSYFGSQQGKGRRHVEHSLTGISGWLEPGVPLPEGWEWS